MLEFIDFGSEMRRDVWYVFISEIIVFYKFIYEYGFKEGEYFVFYVYGVYKGKERVIISVISSIFRF